ncbi:GH36-type glycosyl hydrolase domain-containing protein [Ensifer sp. B1-9]|uniref:GH36-type glycosyl hydrolase domain-containing protein n=1 Tax=Ensifer sp. B1-9 TaxID=3141455 RepID=UPI003D191EAB
MARSIEKTENLASPHRTGSAAETALLSNGSYHVLLTENGSGYASWRGLDVTRWREDVTRDCWGQFFYIRDLDSDDVWSVAGQPIRRPDAKYERAFHGDRAEFLCAVNDIEISSQICVAVDCDAEVRLLQFVNRGTATRKLAVTSYCEVCLNGRRGDSAHPAFAKLFVETWFDPETTALFARRRPRSALDKPSFAVHVSASSQSGGPSVEYETDRYRFLGRGGTPSNPGALETGQSLSATTGPVLDPIFSLRRVVVLEPSETAQLAFVTGASEGENAALAIARRFSDIAAAGRALSLAMESYTNAAATFMFTADKVADYYQLAGALARSNPDLRNGGVHGEPPLEIGVLWSNGVSGELPILLLRLDQKGRNSLLRDALDAHTFLTGHGLAFDLLLLDESGADETARLREQVAESQHEELLDKPGGIHALCGAKLPSTAIATIVAAARVVLASSLGSLGAQIAPRTSVPLSALRPETTSRRQRGQPGETPTGLLFWNGHGGFTQEGREYVIAAQRVTPAPWCNVIANPEFGCMTSESGLGYTWAANSQLNRLTPWSNDPVSDPPGEVVYLRDDRTGEIWTPTPLPLGQSWSTTISHGQGYTRYEGASRTLHHEMTVHVPVSAPLKIIQLVIRNEGTEARAVSATYFLEWVLGTLREDASARIACEHDTKTHAIIARHIWQGPFAGRLAFVASSIPPRSFTCDRSEFLGRNGSVIKPLGLNGSELSGSTNALRDPCAALTVEMSVLPGQSVELVFVLGQATSRDDVRRLVREYAEPNGARRSLEAATRQWDQTLSAITVRTPDKAFDLMMNRWLLYQVLVCRVWARTGFYQSGGAYGFRDQLQDVLALVHCAPQEARAHILRAAARQFTEGDVQHWWHPPTGVGVRTRITDDLYFLPYVVQNYVSVTGDYALLSERVPFISSPVLTDEQEETFGVPEISSETATLYEHCCRALERGLRTGRHGLPLMGTGDWNDGMNKVGAEGLGESVWNGWYFLTVLKSFATLATARGDNERGAWCEDRAEALRVSLETHTWDGSWYRRAYFDDGTPLGSSVNDECQIDAIPQAWAVISGSADAERASKAMQAVWERLVRPEDKLIRLFDPPFDKGALQPGYIKGYVPGIRENGGQYTHAAAWVVLATALLGDGDRAFDLWSMLNPINHALSAEDSERYVVEPYVVSADIYGAAPHTGRGGWTWYTGSAGWLYRVGLEAILGIRRQGGQLFIEPCMPTNWPGFEVDFRFGSATYCIKISRKRGHRRTLMMDDEELHDLSVPLADDGRNHQILLIVG